jgi:ATP synthase protein I
MTDHMGQRLGDQRANDGQSRGLDASVKPDGGMRALSYIISGILVYGGVGWAIDHWLNQSWGVPAGLIIGMGFGVYLVIKRLGE